MSTSAISRSLVIVLLSLGAVTGSTFAQDDIGWIPPVREGVLLSPVTNSRQQIAALNRRLAEFEQRPIERIADRTTARGDGAFVYREAAPAIVYVTDGNSGHGTGFFVREDGWIVTNQHVVQGMPFDKDTGVRMARIVTGALDDDGAMTAIDGFHVADVYCMDELRDLALLKIRTTDDQPATFPFIELAERTPAPGSVCVVIGHPSMGVLWTLRQGEIAGRGQFPRDQIGELFQRGADSQISDRLNELFDQMETRKVTLSSCGLNPGDSGGPLLDTTAQLVGVSFAVPTIDWDRGVERGKFSYHVHLDEVQAFLAVWPEEPVVTPPSLLPPATLHFLDDLDQDGGIESWVFLIDEDSPPSGLFVDLDGDSDAEFIQRALQQGLRTETPLTAWDWEFAMVKQPQLTFLFDTNNDRECDRALVVDESGDWIQFRKEAERWAAAPYQGDILTDEFFESAENNDQFRQFLKNLK